MVSLYADRPNIEVATASNVAGPYTIQTIPALHPLAPSGTWDSYRVDEPFVFQHRDGTGSWYIWEMQVQQRSR